MWMSDQMRNIYNFCTYLVGYALCGVVTTTPCIYLGRNRLIQQLQITSGTGTAKVSSNGDGAKIRRGWRWGEEPLPKEGL